MHLHLPGNVRRRQVVVLRLQALAPGGVFVIKENVSTDAFWIDEDDGYMIRYARNARARMLVLSSVITAGRSREYCCKVFELAGLRVLAQAPQVKWPSDAFAVHMYALGV